jgi:coatomer subunit beta'
MSIEIVPVLFVCRDCIQIYEGHSHYVMQVEFNPKDPNTFASASLDRSIKVWGLTSNVAHFSLEGHERGVNCVNYYRGGEKPYLISGADDHTVKIWDYQTKACIATLDGHTNNVSCVLFHSELPIILSGSEDGTVRIWHSNTYRLENTLNYGMERVWSIAALKGSNKIAIGYDDGTIMIKVGHEEPVVSMEKGGKIIWAKNHEIQIASVKTAGELGENNDGERLSLKSKELGSCELYPQSLLHDPKGHFIAAVGDGEYIIYTALSLKNKSFGSALEFVWNTEGSGGYATKESASKIKIFKDFKEFKSFRPNFAAEQIFGGPLLGIRSNDFVDFYSWNDCSIIRRIDVQPRKVYWSESGELVVLCCENSFYLLRYNEELVSKFLDQGVETTEQGIEGSFELENEIAEKVKAGYFVGDCFIYTNASGRLNYYVGGEVITLAHLAKPQYLLGYLPKENKVYCMDKSHNIYAYSLLLSVLIYQTAIVRRDFPQAQEALAKIPQSQYNKLARFLESQDLKELALEVSTDSEHKFELAMQCKKLDLAEKILYESESEHKWKQLGDAALSHQFNLNLAEQAYNKANDLGGLLLLYSSTGNQSGLERLANKAKELNKNNIAFLALFLLHRIDDCIELLISTDRIAEAAFMTRTYAPSNISNVLSLWKQNLAQISTKAAEALADPSDYADKFTDLKIAQQVQLWTKQNQQLKPATQYSYLHNDVFRNLIQEMKENKLSFSSQSTPLNTNQINNGDNSVAAAPVKAISPVNNIAPQVNKSSPANNITLNLVTNIINQTSPTANISSPQANNKIASPISNDDSNTTSPSNSKPSDVVLSSPIQVEEKKLAVAPTAASKSASLLSDFDDLDELMSGSSIDLTAASNSKNKPNIPSIDEIDKQLADADFGEF